MKKEEVEKLIELKQEIEILESALAELDYKRLRVKVGDYYTIPIDKVPDLREGLSMHIEQMFEDALDKAKAKLESLTLCTKVEDEPTFKPVELK